MGRPSRANLPETLQLLEKVAKLYYITDLSQQKIADQLYLSRPTVTRLLKEARKRGIVSIRVGASSGETRNQTYESQLMQRFNLRDAVVVKNEPTVSYSLVCAEYLDIVLPYTGYVGLGGGNTCFEVAQQLNFCEKRKKLTLVQLSGNPDALPDVTIAHKWSSALGCSVSYIMAPLLVQNEVERSRLMENQSIKATFSAMEKVEMAIVGIGTPIHTLARSDITPESGIDIDEVKKESVGDIIMHFYNSQGQFCHPEISCRVIGISTDQYLNIPMRIALAYGSAKAYSIYVALSGLVNVLITDEHTAQKILSYKT